MRVEELGFACLFALLAGCGSSMDGTAGQGGRGGTGGGGIVSDDEVVVEDPEEACALGVASTFQAIQVEVFDKYGCTSSLCHGTTTNPAGGLDLTPSNAHANLVGVAPDAPVHFDAGQSSIDYKRVFPGDQDLSFLYLKLAAKTLGHALPQGGGQAMPSGGDAALTTDELEIVKKWIRGGAPKGNVVIGTEHAFECGLTEQVSANKIPPVDPPPSGAGVQFYSGAYELPQFSEDEVCFATYYDFTKPGAPVIPAEARIDCPPEYASVSEGCFAFKSTMLGQDPQSHHSSIMPYAGSATPADGAWGSWQCLGGDNHGRVCDPTRFGVQASAGGADCGERSACTSTLARRAPGCFGYGPADFNALNGAGIGGAQEAISYRTAVDGIYLPLPMKGFLLWNSHAYNLTERDTTIEQWLNMDFAFEEDQQFVRQTLVTYPSLSAMGSIAPFTHKEVCARYTFERYTKVLSLNSHTHLRGVRFRTWAPPHAPCGDPAGPDPLASARTCVGGTPRPGTPIYESEAYDDPLNLEFSEPWAMDDADPANRTFYFCSVFDNGDEYPEKLKRNSTSVGTQCSNNALVCVGGVNEGQSCNGNDAICGAGGDCDACPVGPGVTTEDEMFLMTAEYYLDVP